MVRRHEIQVLRRAGHGLVETAKLVGASQSSVQRVEDEPPVTSFESDAERARHEVGRPSKTEPFRSFLIAELAVQPNVLSVELFRRAKLKAYTGGKSALYALVKELRPERPRPVVRFEGLPGEFSQHDFGHVDVRFLDRRIQRVHFFASRLKYSRSVQVTLVENEQVEALVRAMVEHFAAWGWSAAARGVRPPQDHRARVGQGRHGHRMEPDVRRGHARRVAPRGQHPAALARDWHRARGTARRGAAAASSAAHPARRARAANSGAGRPDGLRRARHPSLLDAARRARAARHAVPLSRPRPHRRRSLPGRACPQVWSRRRLDLARAPGATRRRGLRQARQALHEARAPDRARRARARVHHRTRPSPAQGLDPRRRPLHDLLERYGDDALRAAFEISLANGAIGAEYIHHYLTTTLGVALGAAVHQELV